MKKPKARESKSHQFSQNAGHEVSPKLRVGREVVQVLRTKSHVKTGIGDPFPTSCGKSSL